MLMICKIMVKTILKDLLVNMKRVQWRNSHMELDIEGVVLESINRFIIKEKDI